MWTLISRRARFAPALGAGREAAAPPRRRASHRSSESAAPLGPMARYSVSIALIWSRPNVAAGNPVGKRDRDHECQDRGQARPQSECEQGEHDHGESLGGPDPALRERATRTNRCTIPPGAFAPDVRSASSGARRNRRGPVPRRHEYRAASSRSALAGPRAASDRPE